MEFTRFIPQMGQQQKLPPVKKYVLCLLKNIEPGQRNPVVVGYLKYHSGDEDCPFFVTPGASIKTEISDERVISWCDCLPETFDWPDKE